MSSIKIRVGVALDANAASVLQPIIKASQRARKAIEDNLNAAARAGARAPRQVGDSWEKLGRQLEREAEKRRKAEEKSAQAAVKAEQKGEQAKLREVERAERAKTKEVEQEARRRDAIVRQSSVMAGRYAAQQAAAEAREARRAERDRARDRGGWGGAIGIGRRAGIRVSRGAAMAYGYGGAALSSFAHGIGINTDVAEMMQEGINNQDLAQKIIDSDPRSKGMGVEARQSAAAGLLGQAKGVANETAFDTGDTLEALETFVAKTGDLQTAKESIRDLSILSKATGTHLNDMADAAAEVSNHLGDVPDKAKTVYNVMRAVAGQGQLGAMEIKDYAKQMAKIASQSTQFEGDQGQNIAILGAMAQESKLRGGSANARQAGTSVMSFVSNLTKGATLKNWTKAGLSPYTDASRTKLRSPEELILEALKSTKGNLPGLQKLFGSAQSMRAVQGFASIYSEAGGGQAGLEAVDAEFRRLSQAAMSQADVMAAFGAQMQTTKSKVQVFNNELQQSAEKIEVALIPAFDELLPVLTSVVGGFSSMVDSDWMRDFWGTVLHGGDQTLKREQNKEFATQIEGSNYLSKLHSFENTNLVPTGAGPFASWSVAGDANIAESLRNAEPVFAEGQAKQDSLGKEIDELQGRVAEEGKAFGAGTSHALTDAQLQESIASPGGNDAASKYLADKQALERLKDTQVDLKGALDQLRQAITSGQFTVKLAPGGAQPPAPKPGGAAPPDSPNPQ